MLRLRRYLLLLPILIVGCDRVVSTSVSLSPAGTSLPSPSPVTKSTRKVSSFSRVKVSDAFDVEIRVGGAAGVTVEAPSNYQSLIGTTVKGDVLEVGLTRSATYKDPIRIRITTPKLEGLSISGASSVKAMGAKTNRFTIDATGAAHIDLEGQVQELQIDSVGASAISLKGKAARANISAKGASAIEASAFKVEDVVIRCDGASTAKFSSLKSLDAQADGASQIVYRSVGKLKRSEESGASHIGRE